MPSVVALRCFSQSIADQASPAAAAATCVATNAPAAKPLDAPALPALKPYSRTRASPPKHGKWKIVGRGNLPRETFALSEHQRARKGAHAGVYVDNRPSGEIQRRFPRPEDAAAAQQASAPDPMSHGIVNQRGPQQREDAEGGELHPLGERPDD